MNLRIKDMVGPRCIIKDHGQLVFDSIHDPIQSGETVVLDFSEVTQFASPFFNFAIGQLLKDIDVEDLRKRLQIENLEPTGKLVVERVLENASRYYTDIDYREIVDSILAQQAKEND